MDRLDLFAVQGTLKSLLQHHSSKAAIVRCSVFFTVQFSHQYMATGKAICRGPAPADPGYSKERRLGEGQGTTA